jgi:hypothetical protein
VDRRRAQPAVHTKSSPPHILLHIFGVGDGVDVGHGDARAKEVKTEIKKTSFILSRESKLFEKESGFRE